MSNWSINGITSITVTSGEQRKSKRAGLSYDFMDKLNSLVDKGIFIDKDNNGFTNNEKLELCKAFQAIHADRKDIKSFETVQAGQVFDYNDSEFLRLAEAAGYILKDNSGEAITIEQPEQIEQSQETSDSNEQIKIEETPETKQPAIALDETGVAEPEDEISRLKDMLPDLTYDTSQEGKILIEEEINHNKQSLKREIADLEKNYTTETKIKHRIFGEDKIIKTEKQKSEEQIMNDLELAKEKRQEYDELAKLDAVAKLYSSKYPTKYAPKAGDKSINRIITTEDNQKLAKVLENETVSDKSGNSRTTLVEKYYPLSLRDFNENKENSFPQYYYRVDKNARPVDYKP